LIGVNSIQKWSEWVKILTQDIFRMRTYEGTVWHKPWFAVLKASLRRCSALVAALGGLTLKWMTAASSEADPCLATCCA